MSVKEVQITERSRQLEDIFKMVYTDVSVVTNNIALYRDYGSKDKEKTLKAIRFDDNGRVKDNISAGTGTYFRLVGQSDIKPAIQVSYVFKSNNEDCDTIIELKDGRIYLCDNYLRFNRKNDLVFGYSTIGEPKLINGVIESPLDFVLIEANNLEIRMIDNMKEPPCLPTASSFIIQCLTLDNEVYGFNREGKMFRQANGEWVWVSV